MHVIPYLVCLLIVCSVYQTQIRHSNTLTPVPPTGAIVAFMGFGLSPSTVFTLIIGSEFISLGEFQTIITNRSSIAIHVPLTYERNMELLENESNHTNICEHVGNTLCLNLKKSSNYLIFASIWQGWSRRWWIL